MKQSHMKVKYIQVLQSMPLVNEQHIVLRK